MDEGLGKRLWQRRRGGEEERRRGGEEESILVFILPAMVDDVHLGTEHEDEEPSHGHGDQYTQYDQPDLQYNIHV